MPTETAPTTVPSLSRSGTLPRAERPRVPLSISMTSLPARAWPGSVETMPPICFGSVCDQRTPRQSITTMYSAWVAFRIRSASCCTGPFGGGRRLPQVLGELRLLRGRLRDRERAAHRLVVQLVAEGREEQPGREDRDSRGDRHLHQQHLREHPPRQAEAQAACGGSGAHTQDRTCGCLPAVDGCGVDLLISVAGRRYQCLMETVPPRRPDGQLASAVVTLSSRTATTSIRAGEPRTDAPQLSGRGGRAAPWATSTCQRRPSVWATVTSQRGAAPAVRTTLSASAAYSPGPGAHGELGRLTGPFPGRAAPASLHDDPPLPGAVQDLLEGVGLGPAVRVSVRQHEHRRREAVTTQMGDLPDALDSGRGELGSRGGGRGGRSSGPACRWCRRGRADHRRGAGRRAPRRKCGGRPGRARRSRGRAAGRGPRSWRRAATRFPERCGPRTPGVRRACGGRRGARGGG